MSAKDIFLAFGDYFAWFLSSPASGFVLVAFITIFTFVSAYYTIHSLFTSDKSDNKEEGGNNAS